MHKIKQELENKTARQQLKAWKNAGNKHQKRQNDEFTFIQLQSILNHIEQASKFCFPWYAVWSYIEKIPSVHFSRTFGGTWVPITGWYQTNSKINTIRPIHVALDGRYPNAVSSRWSYIYLLFYFKIFWDFIHVECQFDRLYFLYKACLYSVAYSSL